MLYSYYYDCSYPHIGLEHSFYPPVDLGYYFCHPKHMTFVTCSTLSICETMVAVLYNSRRFSDRYKDVEAADIISRMSGLAHPRHTRTLATGETDGNTRKY